MLCYFLYKTKKKTIDTKYERFGWREWTLQGTTQCLNGEPYALHGDSWHFMGIPQMTRRYAWAWFTAIKGMNGNAGTSACSSLSPAFAWTWLTRWVSVY